MIGRWLFMKKILKKLSVAALCLAAAISLAVPAMALPSGSYSVLNVRYAPNGTPVNDVEYRAYKVAEAVKDDQGGYAYTLTQAFQASGVDLNKAMNGGQLSDGTSETYRTLLNQFGTFINENSGSIQPAATAVTGTKTIGANQTPENGVAQFTGLSDGLYLVSTRIVTTIGNTQYTAVPFLVNIPYEMDGVMNNYLTATAKFTTYTPSNPNPNPNPGPGPGPNPNPGTGSNPNPPAPANPTPPEEVTVPENPTPAGAVDPVPENTVDPAQPEIEIGPEEVPLAEAPENPEIEINEELPPLARLPQTGLLWWPVPLMALAGAVFIVFGVGDRRRNSGNA